MKLMDRIKRKSWGIVANYLYRMHSHYAVPTELGLCLTHLCNIKCVYCMRETYTPEPALITLEQVKAITKRVPYVTGFCIMGLCEPFLNPEAANIVRWLKDDAEYTISLTTNGMVKLTEDRLDALLRVDDFVISIDTNDPETFKYLRGGADLDRVIESLKRVIEYKRHRSLGKMDNPPIHINSVITSLNFGHIPSLIEMLEPYADDLNYLMIDPVSRPDYQEFEDPLMIQKADFNKHIVEYRKIAKDSPLKIVGLDYMLIPSFDWPSCNMTWHSPFVEPNGDVYFCYNYKYVLGNIFNESLISIWNNSKAREFRKQVLSSNPPLHQFKTCNFARTGWQSGGDYYMDHEDVTY